MIGASALIGTDNLSNATAIGAGAVVNQSNSIVLGSFNPVTNVGIGTTTPSARLDVAGNVNLTGTLNFSGQQILSNAGSQNLFAGIGAGPTNTGTNNAFFGFEAGFSNTSGSNNAFFGRLAGVSNLGGNLDSFFGSQAGVQNTSGNNNSFFGRKPVLQTPPTRSMLTSEQMPAQIVMPAAIQCLGMLPVLGI